LESQLAATAAGIAGYNDDTGAANRRLLQIQNRRASLEARPVVAPSLAVAGRRAVPEEPPSYQWSEQSPYVTVPKSALKDLGLPGLSPLVHEFSLSPVMTEALSLQPAELARVNSLLAETKAAHDRLVTSHAQPTNGHIQWFRPNNGPMRSFIVAPFPEAGDSLLVQLKNGLEQTVGSSRTEILWPHAENSLRSKLSEIGQAERWLTVHLSETPEGGLRPDYYENVKGKYGRGIHGDPPDFLKRAAEEARPNPK
jgi:hypothetical protein